MLQLTYESSDDEIVLWMHLSDYFYLRVNAEDDKDDGDACFGPIRNENGRSNIDVRPNSRHVDVDE